MLDITFLTNIVIHSIRRAVVPRIDDLNTAIRKAGDIAGRNGGLVRLSNSGNHGIKGIDGVSYSCGYQSPSSFARAFRNYYGMAASEFRDVHATRKASSAS